MNKKLDEDFDLWISRFGIDWAIRTSDVPKYLAVGEIENRHTVYPALRQAVQQPLSMFDLGAIGRKCWSLSEQHDQIRFGEFVEHPDSAVAVTQLITEFPKSDGEAASRIDDFIDRCAGLGYADPKTGSGNRASAAVLASTILAAVFPKRFVDYRKSRWKDLADELGTPLFENAGPSHGEMIVEASRFAEEICDTPAFKRFWPNGEPLWTISGVCWTASTGHGAEGPSGLEPYCYEEDFDEGARTLRLHLIRERNLTVVRKAKELWRATDPLLRCDVCQFSFIEAYGDLGEGYIEAHHTKPIGSLRAGAKTRVSDLAKVCANCHRMLHVDARCLELDELRAKLSKETFKH